MPRTGACCNSGLAGGAISGLESQWLTRYDDLDFSLTDAVSLAAMTERGITEALTLDRHFAAAGFVSVG